MTRPSPVRRGVRHVRCGSIKLGRRTSAFDRRHDHGRPVFRYRRRRPGVQIVTGASNYAEHIDHRGQARRQRQRDGYLSFRMTVEHRRSLDDILDPMSRIQ